MKWSEREGTVVSCCHARNFGEVADVYFEGFNRGISADAVPGLQRAKVTVGKVRFGVVGRGGTRPTSNVH